MEGRLWLLSNKEKKYIGAGPRFREKRRCVFLANQALSMERAAILFLYARNLVPRVFVPYCAGFTKRATLQSSVTRSTLISLKDNTNGRK